MVTTKSTGVMTRPTTKGIVFAALSSLLVGCSSLTEPEQNVWAKSYNETTQQRFIPVELFTGATWDGKHQLQLKQANTIACAVCFVSAFFNFFIHAWRLYSQVICAKVGYTLT